MILSDLGRSVSSHLRFSLPDFITELHLKLTDLGHSELIKLSGSGQTIPLILQVYISFPIPSLSYFPYIYLYYTLLCQIIPTQIRFDKKSVFKISNLFRV